MGISAQLVLASRSIFATQSKSHRLKYVIMTDTASKYAVKLKTNFDDPKWINRHKFMFNFLDINGNGKITLDEIVSKASDDICAKLGKTRLETLVSKQEISSATGERLFLTFSTKTEV